MSREAELSLQERLGGLAAFLPAFETPGFRFGEWSGFGSPEPGVMTMPYFTLSERASVFIQAAYDLGWVQKNFDWGSWKGTSEAEELRDSPANLALATPEQLARLLTVVIRQERFVEGSLDAAYQSGLLTGIVRRAKALLSESIRRSD